MKNGSFVKKIASGAITIIIMGLIAKCASFLVETTLAAVLGATNESDAYYMVSGIHDVLYPMLGIGVWKVFLPLYKSFNSLGYEERANSIADISITFFTLISAFFSFLLYLSAEYVVYFVAPGFDEYTHQLCVNLIKISSPMYIFIVASSVYASMLQSKRKFMASQIRQTATHIPTLFGAYFLYKYFGVEVLAFMLVVGSVFRLSVELPFVDWGYRYKFSLDFKSDDFVTMLRRLPSALISVSVTQINTLVDKVIASTLPVGAVSCLNYGHKLMNVFSGLLSSAIATSMYPQIVELSAKKEKDKLSHIIYKTIIVFALLMIPVSIGSILYRKELVSIVFLRGNFNNTSVMITSNVFGFYCLGLLFIASNDILNNVFYANGDTKTPMKISIIALVTNVGLNIIFSYFLGVSGLALATSVSAAAVFWITIYKSKMLLDINIKSLLKKIISIVGYACLACFPPFLFVNHFVSSILFKLICGCIISVVFYFVILLYMHVEEFGYLVNIVKNKISKRERI